jgi:hypothetical protein
VLRAYSYDTDNLVFAITATPGQEQKEARKLPCCTGGTRGEAEDKLGAYWC